MIDKRELLSRLLRGEVTLPELLSSLRHRAIVGILSGDIVEYSDPASGEQKSASRAEFEALPGNYDKILVIILNPCPPITSEDAIPEDI